MIRKAVMADMEQIMAIVAHTIEMMNREGNPQWDENYPARVDFLEDIKAGTLFVWETDGLVEGMACVNCREPEEYAGVEWAQKGPCTVIHRLAVAPESRGKGIGRALLTYAEKTAMDNGTRYLKSDTYGINEKMNGLLQRLGYTMRGKMSFKGKPGNFHCYDKRLEKHDAICPGV